MSSAVLTGLAVLVAAATDDTNRTLAIGTVAVSTILIIAAIVYIIGHRDVGTPTDEGLLKALDAVEWYATDVGDELLAAAPDRRQEIVKDSAKRIESAHAALITNAPVVDNRNWEQLVVELTDTESAYNAFAQSDTGDKGSINQHQHVLTEKLEQFRANLG